jgi:hypothetical protein
VLTVVGGKVVYAAGDFEKLGPASPGAAGLVAGGQGAGALAAELAAAGAGSPVQRACAVHSHSHEKARLSNAPVSDFAGFWGASAARALLSDEYKKAPARWPGATCNIHPPRSFL